MSKSLIYCVSVVSRDSHAEPPLTRTDDFWGNTLCETTETTETNKINKIESSFGAYVGGFGAAWGNGGLIAKAEAITVLRDAMEVER